MNIEEKDALLVYLESRILDFCDQQVDSLEPATIYDDAYAVLSDIECSISAIVEIQQAEEKKSTNI